MKSIFPRQDSYESEEEYRQAIDDYDRWYSETEQIHRDTYYEDKK